MNVERISTPKTYRDLRVEKVVTHGTFRLDGGTWEVDNNVYIVGNDAECLVIDPAHDSTAVAAGVAHRTVAVILCTHGHNDHVNGVDGVRRHERCHAMLHPDDRMLWDHTVGGAPDRDLADEMLIWIAQSGLHTLHTPGHSPGSCCFYSPDLGVVFTGDTLFAGGPGATGRSFSDFDEIITSIRTKLLTLPPDTLVLPGHGEATTIGDEAPHLKEWIKRGH